MRQRLIEEIVLYRQLKAARDPEQPSAYAEFSRSEELRCEILSTAPHGYSVLIKRGNLPGFLPTAAVFSVGSVILARFVCIHQTCIVVTDSLSDATVYAPPGRNEQDDSSLELTSLSMDDKGAVDVALKVLKQFRCKRATDLIPTLKTNIFTTYKSADYPHQRLLCELERKGINGCIQAFNEQLLTRSAMLLYEGRMIGCIYGSKFAPDTGSTPESLVSMLSDLGEEETIFSVYEQPRDVMFSMAALFAGHPLESEEKLSAPLYMDRCCQWLQQEQLSGCLTIMLPASSSTVLYGVENGQFKSARWVEDEVMTEDGQSIRDALGKDSNALVQASVLPGEPDSFKGKLGHSLRELIEG